MSSVRDKIIGYLAAGVTQSAAAEAAGVTPGYVSQLLEEEGVRSEIAAVRGDTLNKQLKQDEKLEEGEKKALEKMVNMIPFSRSLGEITKTFAVLNSARRKAEVARNPTGENGAGVSVTLVLPQAASLMLQINAQNQVVDVGGQSIAPLPSKELPKLAAAMAQRAGTMAVPVLDAPVKPHVVEHQQKMEAKDREAATHKLSIMDDHKFALNGVQVVI